MKWLNRCRPLWISASLILTACASTPQTRLIHQNPDHLPARAEIQNLPFVPQSEQECGPATLAMMSLLTRSLASLLICSFLVLPSPHAAYAEMVSTDTVLSESLQSTPRDRLLLLVQKDEVIKKLQEYGVTAGEAKERIASLSDAEVLSLNAKIDQLPAGGDAVGAVLGTALAIFVILLITDILCLTKVFKFTRCAQ